MLVGNLCRFRREGGKGKWKTKQRNVSNAIETMRKICTLVHMVRNYSLNLRPMKIAIAVTIAHRIALTIFNHDEEEAVSDG
jgi:hypothetical protein